MGRAMMVAGKTSGAQAVVEPTRRIAVATIDISYWTDRTALAATGTGIGINGELGVGHPMLDKKAAQQAAVGARQTLCG